jgi:hypothetical protein
MVYELAGTSLSGWSPFLPFRKRVEAAYEYVLRDTFGWIGFLNHLAELNMFGCLRGKVTYPRMYIHVVLPNAGMEREYRTDYDTLVNPYSLAHTLPDVYLERVILDDEKRPQMFENRRPRTLRLIHMTFILHLKAATQSMLGIRTTCVCELEVSSIL